MIFFRSLDNKKKYSKYKKRLEEKNIEYCPFCDIKKIIIIKKFKYWFIAESKFSYDGICKTDNLLVVNRHNSSKEDLSFLEFFEYWNITTELLNDYDYIIEDSFKKLDFKNHYYIHLIKV